MNRLKTTYLGLELRNPLIVGSSSLGSTREKLIRLDEAGAGAVVLKSVFEEQILHETTHLENFTAYTEAGDYLRYYLQENYLGQYLNLIRDAKQTIGIPVIGSICCVASGAWEEFARRIEEAGADALELNIFLLPTDAGESSEAIERRYLKIVEQVIRAVSIPVAVKIGSRFTNPLSIVRAVEHRGARGVVMFNRFFEPDFDINTLQVVPAEMFSTSDELRGNLRWIGMASAAVPQLDIAASTGVHTGEDAAKVLLAGASAFEVCSAIYREGVGVIGQINATLRSWMQQQGFESINEVVGKLNYNHLPNPLAYERAQFMKYFGNQE